MKVIVAVLAALTLITTLIGAVVIHPVRGLDTISIQSDGSVDPPGAPILRDGDMYTLVGDVYDSYIGIERGNMTIDGSGHGVQGPGLGIGYGVWVFLGGNNNVTIRNIAIKGFQAGIYVDGASDTLITGNTLTGNSMDGIWLASASNTTVVGNNVTNNYYGVSLSDCSGSRILRNEISNNSASGVYLTSSSENSIRENSLSQNNEIGILVSAYSHHNTVVGNTVVRCDQGIQLSQSANNIVKANNVTTNRAGIALGFSSSDNIVCENTIMLNDIGIWIDGPSSTNNTFYHNNVVENVDQMHYLFPGYSSIWDDGYPSGGNFWSDYTDLDLFRGPLQNAAGKDGVWDHPYMIDPDNQDRYPLSTPFGWFPAGDVDGDHDIDIFDIVTMAGAYQAKYPDPRYNRLCDLDLDGDIDIFDIVKAAGNYGESW